jgi:hypothetical protein
MSIKNLKHIEKVGRFWIRNISIFLYLHKSETKHAGGCRESAGGKQ